MEPFAYDTPWLLIAALFVVPAVFVALCRQALRRYSRKLLLERVPSERHEKLEEELSRRDEYQNTLEHLEFLLCLGLAVCLAAGRIFSLDQSTAEQFKDFPGQCLLLVVAGLEVLVVIVLLCGLLPSLIAGGWAEGWLLRVLPAIQWQHKTFGFIQRPLQRAIGAGVLLLAGRREPTSQDIAEEEILTAMDEGEREGLLESTDVDMIESIISFGDVKVSEVMTPRTEMVCLDLEDTQDANLQRAIECGHSRIPVCRRSKDNIVGLLYVKDLLPRLYRKQEFTLESLLRSPYLVGHTKKIEELLQEFKNTRMHIAIVLDEHGGTAGLVTIEDILEEIVGEIADEFETQETAPIERLSEKLVEVDASVHIDDLNDELGIAIPEEESYETLGGFLFANLGRVPKVGHVTELNGVRLEVTAADERRVQRLRVHLQDSKTTSGAEPDVGSDK